MKNSQQATKEKPIQVPCIAKPGQTPQSDDTGNCLDPCAVVIMGATGDLTARKLIPALFDLYEKDKLPPAFSIVGCGRTSQDSDQFRAHMSEALQHSGVQDSKMMAGFVARLHYQAVQYDDQAAYDNLSTFLRELDRDMGTQGNRIFYLALPPTLYLPVARGLEQPVLPQSEPRATGGPGWWWKNPLAVIWRLQWRWTKEYTRIFTSSRCFESITIWPRKRFRTF